VQPADVYKKRVDKIFFEAFSEGKSMRKQNLICGRVSCFQYLEIHRVVLMKFEYMFLVHMSRNHWSKHIHNIVNL
jgi:hypothetical protein